MGAVDENYKRLIPGRFPDVWDWVLDFTDVLLAILVMKLLAKKKLLQIKKAP